MSQSARALPLWRVEFSKEAKLCPWNVIGPDGLECGCASEKDAMLEANKWNRVYERGRNAALSESAPAVAWREVDSKSEGLIDWTKVSWVNPAHRSIAVVTGGREFILDLPARDERPLP